MDKDTIIRLAREAGFIDADEKGVWITDGYWDEELAAFAALVAAHEREACAKVCDEWAMFQLAFDLAGQIRARSRT